MKSFIFRIPTLSIFLAAILGLASCSDTVTSQKGSGDGQPQPAAETNVEAPKKKSDYPPIATAVAQSDIKNLDGTTFKVADKKGKVILLNLWATWCGPCRAEMPALVRMQKELGEKGLEVVGLNTDDETVEQINEFAGSMNLNYTLTWADDDLQAALLRISKFNGIPQSFIIDRDGNLRGVFRGANPADIKKMEELVALVVNE